MDILVDSWQNNSRLSQELQASCQTNTILSQQLENERSIHRELNQTQQQLTTELQICRQQRNYFEQALQEMQHSAFWRITKPLRILLDRFKRK